MTAKNTLTNTTYSFTYASSGRNGIAYQVGAIAPGTYVLTVPYNGSTVSAGTLTVNPIVSMSSISPQSLSPGNTLTISGQNLDKATSVNFASGIGNTGSGYKVTTFLSQTPTEIQVAVPPNAMAGMVTMDGPCSMDAKYLDIVPATPTVTAVTQTSYCSGDSITITGTGLDKITQITATGATYVYDTPTLGLRLKNSTTLRAALPAVPDSIVTLRYNTANGQLTETHDITIYNTPGPIEAGFGNFNPFYLDKNNAQLALYGHNFTGGNYNQPASRVTIGGVLIINGSYYNDYFNANNNSIVNFFATIAAEDQHDGPLVVANRGCSTTVAQVRFINPPSVSNTVSSGCLSATLPP